MRTVIRRGREGELWFHLQVQQAVLHQNLPPLLLQQGLGIRVLGERLHQVVLGKAEEVGVADAADVGRAPVPRPTA